MCSGERQEFILLSDTLGVSMLVDAINNRRPPGAADTLGPVVEGLTVLAGVAPRRIHVDKGYRGHNHPNRFQVWITGQLRRVTKAIRREMNRRAVVETAIGHAKAEHRMARNYLKGREGDRANAVLAAAGYDFHLLVRWMRRLMLALLALLFKAAQKSQTA